MRPISVPGWLPWMSPVFPHNLLIEFGLRGSRHGSINEARWGSVPWGPPNQYFVRKALHAMMHTEN